MSRKILTAVFLVLAAALVAAPQTNTFCANNLACTVNGAWNHTGGLQINGVNAADVSSSQTISNKTLTSATLTSATLTSPAVNGTPTGTGIPTMTLKKGSAGANYSTTQTFLANADTTNLQYVVTIPTGWKLYISSSGSGTTATAVANLFVAITDGGSTISQIQITPSGASVFSGWALNRIIAGDGNSHTIDLAFATSNASDAATILNGSSVPVMTFLLSPSN